MKLAALALLVVSSTALAQTTSPILIVRCKLAPGKTYMVRATAVEYALNTFTIKRADNGQVDNIQPEGKCIIAPEIFYQRPDGLR